MALNEACQVWIEQRIEEELSERGDTGKSLREIGRELAAEIERVFDAKMAPDTIRKRAARMPRTNVQQPETTAATPVQAGNSGNKLTPQEVVVQVKGKKTMTVFISPPLDMPSSSGNADM